MHTLSVGCHINFTELLLQIDQSFPNGLPTFPPNHFLPNKFSSMTGATPAEVQQSANNHFDCICEGLLDMKPHLEDRVFIAVTRGLWDNVAKELFLFVMDLREDQHNKAIITLLWQCHLCLDSRLGCDARIAQSWLNHVMHSLRIS